MKKAADASHINHTHCHAAVVKTLFMTKSTNEYSKIKSRLTIRHKHVNIDVGQFWLL